MSRNYKFHSPEGLYFISFATPRYCDAQPCGSVDFKSFTAKELIKLIIENPQESRKEWMLNPFQKVALSNSNNTKNQFWQHHNKPIELWSNDVIQQKIDYIHNNPVVAGFVENPELWKYSSAKGFKVYV